MKTRALFSPRSSCARTSTLVAVVALALGVSPAAADEVNGVRYAVPEGWKAAERNGLPVLAPSRLAPGEVMSALVLGVQPASGTPAAQVAQVADAVNADAKVVGSSRLVTTDRGAVGTFHIQSFDVESADLGAHTRMVVLLVRGNRRAVAMLVISTNAVLQKYGAGVQALIESLAISPSAAPAAPVPVSRPAGPAAPPASGRIPTGDTPDLFPGSPGWLPSGRGVRIPPARLVEGRPQGLWWHPQARSGRTVAMLTLFLPDGTRASSPRPGAGDLFDVEGQKRQRGATGVGTFELAGGRITQAYDGFVKTDTFRTGSDADGAWIEIGAGRHRPLAPPAAKGLVGTWSGAGGRYVFRADGTYESGHVSASSELTIAAGGRGTYVLDGYLLSLRPADGPGWITTIGASGAACLVIGPTLYCRD